MPSTDQTVLLHLGQCGVQLGMATWELFLQEHGLYADGTLATELGHVRRESQTEPFFMETCKGKYVPRALFWDFDPDVINVIRTGAYRSLISRDNLVSGKEDAANNYARGYYSMGAEFIDCMMDKTRHLVEAADRFSGFMMFRSNGGGTGSGFGSLMLSKLLEEYPKVSKLALECNPSARFSTAAIEPYNSVLSGHSSSDCIDCCFGYENECLYDICTRYLDMRCPSYHNLNHIMAQVVSCLTASFRFPGNLPVYANDINTNLVPYSRIHFPLLTYSPLIPYEKVSPYRFSVYRMVKDLFAPPNHMLKCNTRKGKYMGCTLLFRGDVTPNDIGSAMERLRKSVSHRNRMQFVDWSPAGIKIGMCHQPPTAMPGSGLSCGCKAVLGVMNTTAISETWQRLLKKFDLMYYRRAFVHWYIGEGMEEAEFAEARENLETLMMDFHEIGLDTEDNEHAEYTSHQNVDLTPQF